MLDLQSILNSLNIYDLVMLISLNAALFETVAYFYGVSRIDSKGNIGIIKLLSRFPKERTGEAAILVLHAFVVSLSAVTAMRITSASPPSLASSVFEGVSAAILVAFINVFVLSRSPNPDDPADRALMKDILVAVIVALLFFAARWLLPRPPLNIRIPMAGVIFASFWFFSVLIVIRFYIKENILYSMDATNDIGPLKDAFCLFCILVLICLIPQMNQIDPNAHLPIMLSIIMLTSIALFLEYQFPHSRAGEDLANRLLTGAELTAYSPSLTLTMLWHVSIRSLVLLLFGVVLVFALGYIRNSWHD